MREYKLIHEQNSQGEEEDFFYLVPLGERPIGHAIRFTSKDKAHEYKLALGLGTHPDPQVNAHIYTLLSQTYQEAPLYEVLVERDLVDEEREPGCCQSGCPGCPWTLEQIRLGKL